MNRKVTVNNNTRYPVEIVHEECIGRGGLGRGDSIPATVKITITNTIPPFTRQEVSIPVLTPIFYLGAASAMFLGGGTVISALALLRSLYNAANYTYGYRFRNHLIGRESPVNNYCGHRLLDYEEGFIPDHNQTYTFEYDPNRNISTCRRGDQRIMSRSADFYCNHMGEVVKSLHRFRSTQFTEHPYDPENYLRNLTQDAGMLSNIIYDMKKPDFRKGWTCIGFVQQNVAAAQPITWGAWHKNDVIYVAFRGTKTLEDMMNDATIFPSVLECITEQTVYCHSGFYTTTTTMCTESRLFQKIKNLILGDPSVRWRLCITGHSLGGAVAQLFALRLICSTEYQDFRSKLITMDTITFAAPNVLFVPENQRLSEIFAESDVIKTWSKQCTNHIYEVDPVAFTSKIKEFTQQVLPWTIALAPYFFNVKPLVRIGNIACRSAPAAASNVLSCTIPSDDCELYYHPHAAGQYRYCLYNHQQLMGFINSDHFRNALQLCSCNELLDNHSMIHYERIAASLVLI